MPAMQSFSLHDTYSANPPMQYIGERTYVFYNYSKLSQCVCIKVTISLFSKVEEGHD